MKKSFAILSIAAVGLLSLLLTACPVDYKILSPLAVPASAELTANRDGVIKDTAGANVPAVYNATFDIPALAAAGYVDITKVTSVSFDYTLADDDWWIQYPAITYVIGSANPLVVDVAHTLIPARAGESFHGSTSGVMTVPYVSAGDGKIKIGIGDGSAAWCAVDLKITGAKISFSD